MITIIYIYELSVMEFKHVKNSIICNRRDCPSCKCRVTGYCFICAKRIYSGVINHLKQEQCLLGDEVISVILNKIKEDANRKTLAKNHRKYYDIHGYLEKIGYEMLYHEGKCLICNKIPTGGPGQTRADHIGKCIAMIHRENDVSELLVKNLCDDPSLIKCRLCARTCYYCAQCGRYHKIANKYFIRHGDGSLCMECGFIDQDDCPEKTFHYCYDNVL